MARIYTAKTFDPKNSLGRLLRGVRKVRIVLVEQELAKIGKIGVRSAQVGVIQELFESGAMTAAELSKRLDYDPGAMNRLLGRLQKKGLVCRILPDESDHRLRIELTRAGKALYPDIVQSLASTVPHAHRDFGRAFLPQG